MSRVLPAQTGVRTPKTTAPLLSVRDLVLAPGGRRLLGDVGFELRAGTFTGLIGSNGAGKTSLMRAIAGLDSPLRGQIQLEGRSISGARAAHRASIGYVPQKFLLDPGLPLRGRDLVSLGLDGHRLGIPLPSRRRREQVQRMIDAVGADAFADERVGRLSGGEQQRILIAHAMISRPRLLLLDEPLANLDLRSSREIVLLAARMAREQGVAVLISAHELNPLLDVMDEVIYLASGRAVAGPTSEVIRGDVLSRLYGQHVDVLHVHGRILVVAGAGTPGESGADLTVTDAHGMELGG